MGKKKNTKYNVMIQVASEQWSSDGNQEKPVKLMTSGILEYDKDKQAWTVSYQESEATGMEGTTTLVTLYSDQEVRLRRIGNIEMDVVFVSGKRHISQMRTEYGLIDLSVLTNEVGGIMNEQGGDIHIGYCVNFGNKDIISTKLSFNVQNEKVASHWLN